MPAVKPALRPATKASKANHSLRIVDGRSAEAVLLRKTRDSLLAGIEQPVSPLAASLAERAAHVTLLLLKLDQLALMNSGLEPAQSRLYSSLSTQHSRLIRELSKITPTVPRGTSLAEHLARRAAERGGASA
jgi:hypothetical protein